MVHIPIDDTDPTVSFDVGSATTEFDFNFAYFDEGDIVVTVDDVTLTLTDDYTIEGEGDFDSGFSGGTVTLNAAVSDVTVTISRSVPVERTTDFSDSGNFQFFRALNTSLDKIVAMIQQVVQSVTDLAADLVEATSEFQTLLSRLELLAGGSVPAGVWVDVTASPYDAQGDGSDDTAAIQAAIDSGAPVLYFPAGTYGINEDGLIGVSNQTWIGAGPGATTIKSIEDTATDDMIRFIGKTQCRIRDFTVDWDNRTPAIGSGAIQFKNCTDVSAENIHIINGYRFGFVIVGTTRGLLDKCRIQRDAVDGTFVNQCITFTLSQSHKWIISNCQIDNWGIAAELVDNIIIDKCIIDGFAYGSGIAGGDTAHTMIVTGCIVKNGDTDLTDVAEFPPGLRSGGIETYAPCSAIVGNIVRDNGGAGIHFATDGSAIVANVAWNNGQRSLVPGAVSPNQFGNFEARKVDATSTAQYSAIVGNASRNSAESADWSLLGSGNPEFLTIAGNAFNAGSTAPIDLGTASTNSYVGPMIWVSGTRDPNNLADGDGETASIALAPVTLGDVVGVSFSLDLQDMLMTGYVQANTAIEYRLQNESTSAVNLSSGTIRAVAMKPPTAATY